MQKNRIKQCVISSVVALGIIFSGTIGITEAHASHVYKWQSPEKTITNQLATFIPVREVLMSYGIKVDWKNEAMPKIVLSDDKNSYYVTIDSSKKLATCGDVAYYYEIVNGRICFPVQFYVYVLNHVELKWNAQSKLLTGVVPSDNTVISIKNLPIYAADTKPVETTTYYETGQATWYGGALHGNLTASGERFNMYDLTAAHKTLPFGTRVKVTNLQNGKDVVVRITDRGPFAPGRIIDLSKTAAAQIDMISSGVVPVTLEIIK